MKNTVKDTEEKTFCIVRFSKAGRQRVLRRGLTLDEARAYCSRSDTRGKDWFCGFRGEGV